MGFNSWFKVLTVDKDKIQNIHHYLNMSLPLLWIAVHLEVVPFEIYAMIPPQDFRLPQRCT
jgi:hypothetical protein